MKNQTKKKPLYPTELIETGFCYQKFESNVDGIYVYKTELNSYFDLKHIVSDPESPVDNEGRHFESVPIYDAHYFVIQYSDSVNGNYCGYWWYDDPCGLSDIYEFCIEQPE